MMKILGLHGIGNYRPNETPEAAGAQLSGAWAASLATGTGREVDVTVVYYSDLLRPSGRQGDDSELDDLTPEEELVLADLLAAQDLADPGVAQGWGTAAFRPAIAALARSRLCSERLVEWLLVRFVKEVAAYLAPDGTRATVQDRLRAAIDEHRPDVLIAHSLGSVVAYETLHAHPDAEIPLWITLGSPLAFPKAVFDRLTPAPRNDLGERPTGVRRWANVADPGDLVAVPVHGVGKRFSGVDVDDHQVIHAFDFHKVANYLKSARMASLLA